MDNFIKHDLEKVFKVEKLVTILYLELDKDFYYGGESHDFWELVYIDKGEMICTSDERKFTLKGGELTFHKPHEYHNLSSNNTVAANVSIVSFVSSSKGMQHFDNKIIKLNLEEKNLLSSIVNEGLACFERINDSPPIMGMRKLSGAPFGSEQAIKNLIELFLIKLYRNENSLTKKSRLNINFNGVTIMPEQQNIISFLQENVQEKLTVDDISKALKISGSLLKKSFSEYRAGGIINYFNFLKIERAKELIREKTLNFTQIAQLLKFDNVHYFSKVFKKHIKLTPTEYKNSIKN